MSNYNATVTTVFSGGIDTDSSDRTIVDGDYRELSNGIVDKQGGSDGYAIKNVYGDIEIASIVSGLDNESILSIGSKLYKDTLFIFYVNNDPESLEYNNTELYSVNTTTLAYSRLFTFALGNTIDTKINYIDIVESGVNGDLYVYWVDDINQPFKINASWASGTHNERTVFPALYDFVDQTDAPLSFNSYGTYSEIEPYLHIQIADNSFFIPETAGGNGSRISINAAGYYFISENNYEYRDKSIVLNATTGANYFYGFQIGIDAATTAVNIAAAINLHPYGVVDGTYLVASIHPTDNTIVVVDPNTTNWNVSFAGTKVYTDPAFPNEPSDAFAAPVIVEGSIVMTGASEAYTFSPTATENYYRISFQAARNGLSGAQTEARAVVSTAGGSPIVINDIPIITLPSAVYFSFEVDLKDNFFQEHKLFLYPSEDNSVNNITYSNITISRVQQVAPETYTDAEVDNEYEDVTFLRNIRHVPNEPTITPYTDYSESFSGIQDKAFQFAQRWVYVDDEITPLSTYSKTAFAPKIDSDALSEDGVRSYYVYNGEFVFVESLSATSVISIGHSVNYDRVLTNADNSVIVIYSTSVAAPIKVSYNFGVDFTPIADVNKPISDGCMSIDGKYIYLFDERGNPSVSNNYGASFTVSNERSGAGYYPPNATCSNDGQTVFYALTVQAYEVRYVFIYKSVDYGVTFKYVLRTQPRNASLNQVANICMSPNTKRVLLLFNESIDGTTIVTAYSNDYGNSDSFQINRVPNALRIPMSAAIFNDGTVIACCDNGVSVDIVRTTDLFINQTPIHTKAIDTSLVLYNYNSIIYRDGVMFTYGAASTYWATAFAPSGTRLSDTSFPRPISFMSSAGAASKYLNIQNLYNNVIVNIDKPNSLVRTVEVYAIDTIGGSAYLIKEINNNNIPESGTSITFKNDLIYRMLSSRDKNVLFSNVPTKAQVQTYAGNRLIYMNYEDGVDLPTPNFNVSAEYSPYESTNYNAIKMSSITATWTSGIVLPVIEGQSIVFDCVLRRSDGIVKSIVFQYSFKRAYNNVSLAADEVSVAWQTVVVGGLVTAGTNSLIFNIPIGYTYESVGSVVVRDNQLTYKNGHSIKVGIVYYDEYNRGCQPIFSNSDVVIANTDGNDMSTLKVEIIHQAPSWAKRFKLIRNDRDLYYNVMFGFKYVKYLDGMIYLFKQDGELYTPERGYYLDATDADGVNRTFVVEGKEAKDADFVLGSPAGDWIVIADKGVRGLSGTDIINNTHTFNSSVFYARENTKLSDVNLYYELPNVYYVENGYHLGNEQSQDVGSNAIVRIVDDGNCFYLPNANVYMNKVAYAGIFANCGRPIIEFDNIRKMNRFASMCHSDKFINDITYNGLSMFNTGDVNFKNLDITYGSINAAVSDDTNTYVWQEDATGFVLIDKDAIFSPAGDGNVTSTNNFFGQYRKYSGMYGTSSPRSIASRGGAKYFVDNKRRKPCRLSGDGITEIDVKTTTLFNVENKLGKDYVQSCVFNNLNDEYWLYTSWDGNVYVFDEKNNRWTRTITFEDRPTQIITVNNNILALFENKIIHLCSDEVGRRQFQSSYIVNVEPEDSKVFTSISTDSSIPIEVTVKVRDIKATMYAIDFEDREGEYFAYIRNSGGSDLEEELENKCTIPLGSVVSQQAGVVILEVEPDLFATNDHSLFFIKNNILTLYGDITSIVGKTIYTDQLLSPNNIYDGSFAIAIENSYINGRNLRGNTAKVTLLADTTEPLIIYSMGMNIIKSNN